MRHVSGAAEASAKRNRDLGFDPGSVHAVVLSHAHIDHSGLLPLMAKNGYSGNVYATPATRDLCTIMLMDSAHIQERDAEWLSKKEMAFVPPLYSAEDAQEVMKHFVGVPYETRLPIANDVFLTLHDAGHVLGSAMVEIEYEEGGAWRHFLFTGDIGRNNMPILRDPGVRKAWMSL